MKNKILLALIIIVGGLAGPAQASDGTGGNGTTFVKTADGQWDLGDLHFVKNGTRFQPSPELVVELQQIESIFKHFFGIVIRKASYGNPKAVTRQLFKDDVFDSLIEYRFVTLNELKKICRSHGMDRVPKDLEKVTAGCTDEGITYIAPSLYAELDLTKKALYLLHERVHAFSGFEKDDLIMPFIHGLYVLKSRWYPAFVTNSDDFEFTSKELQVINNLSLRLMQIQGGRHSDSHEFKFMKNGTLLIGKASVSEDVKTTAGTIINDIEVSGKGTDLSGTILKSPFPINFSFDDVRIINSYVNLQVSTAEYVKSSESVSVGDLTIENSFIASLSLSDSRTGHRKVRPINVNSVFAQNLDLSKAQGGTELSGVFAKDIKAAGSNNRITDTNLLLSEIELVRRGDVLSMTIYQMGGGDTEVDILLTPYLDEFVPQIQVREFTKLSKNRPMEVTVEGDNNAISQIQYAQIVVKGDSATITNIKGEYGRLPMLYADGLDPSFGESYIRNIEMINSRHSRHVEYFGTYIIRQGGIYLLGRRVVMSDFTTNGGDLISKTRSLSIENLHLLRASLRVGPYSPYPSSYMQPANLKFANVKIVGPTKEERSGEKGVSWVLMNDLTDLNDFQELIVEESSVSFGRLTFFAGKPVRQTFDGQNGVYRFPTKTWKHGIERIEIRKPKDLGKYRQN